MNFASRTGADCRPSSIFTALPLTRRRFLKVSATASAVAAAAAGPAMSAASYSRVPGANDRVNVGFIGVGLIGRIHLRNFHALPDVRVASIAEAYQPRLEAAQQMVGGSVRGHRDFRKLLEDRELD